MNKFKELVRAIALSFALVFLIGSVTIVSAETIKKLSTAPQLLWNNSTINDATDGSAGSYAKTVDLSAGDFDKCDFFMYYSSAAGSVGTLDIYIDISPDNGTHWVNTSSFTQLTATGTAVNAGALKQNVDVSPGTKLRVYPTLSADTTYYKLYLWAKPGIK